MLFAVHSTSSIFVFESNDFPSKPEPKPTEVQNPQSAQSIAEPQYHAVLIAQAQLKASRHRDYAKLLTADSSKTVLAYPSLAKIEFPYSWESEMKVLFPGSEVSFEPAKAWVEESHDITDQPVLFPMVKEKIQQLTQHIPDWISVVEDVRQNANNTRKLLQASTSGKHETKPRSHSVDWEQRINIQLLKITFTRLNSISASLDEYKELVISLFDRDITKTVAVLDNKTFLMGSHNNNNSQITTIAEKTGQPGLALETRQNNDNNAFFAEGFKKIAKHEEDILSLKGDVAKLKRKSYAQGGNAAKKKKETQGEESDGNILQRLAALETRLNDVQAIASQYGKLVQRIADAWTRKRGEILDQDARNAATSLLTMQGAFQPQSNLIQPPAEGPASVTDSLSGNPHTVFGSAPVNESNTALGFSISNNNNEAPNQHQKD